MTQSRRLPCALFLMLLTHICAVADSTGRTTAEMLLDLARDHGLNCAGKQTRCDVEHIHILLRAATRVDPDLVPAHTWLYELAQLCGDEAAAARALTELLRIDPTNEVAFARWLDAGVRAQQTVEQRRKWLNAVAAAERTPVQKAQVHAHLARLNLEQLDLPAARQHIATALALDAANIDAVLLATEAHDDSTTPADRARDLLRLVQLRPHVFEYVWQAALLFDRYGFVADAEVLFDAALLAHVEQTLDTPPAAFQLDFTRNRMARGRLDDAISLLRDVIRRDPHAAAEAGHLLHFLLASTGQSEQAEPVRQQLARRFAELRTPEDVPTNELAQAAWFYCTLSAQPDRALMLARAATKRAPEDGFVQRVLGWALAANAEPDAARAVLEPIATSDPYAGYRLAMLAAEEDDQDRARRIVAAIDPLPISGPAASLLGTMDLPPAATQPALRYPEMQKALQHFDPRIFAFFAEPEQFVKASLTVADRSTDPGDAWWLQLDLTNRSPIPIPLGPDELLNPVFLISIRMQGDRTREYGALGTVSIDHARTLRPGQSISVRRTIDIGPPRRASRSTPQHLQRISLTAMLAPEQSPAGEWGPGLGGQTLGPLNFNRIPVSTSGTAIRAIFAAAAADSPARQARAIEVLTELLGEQQRATIGHLTYTPTQISARRIQRILIDLLAGDDWKVRVRTLAALANVGLDRELVTAVERCLAHEHWLVRLMSLRVLARLGPQFLEQTERISQTDPDELCRALAAALVDDWRTPKQESAPR